MVDFTSELLGKTSQASDNSTNFSPQIKIVTVGVGGGGNNTVNRLTKVGVKGTELVAVKFLYLSINLYTKVYIE